MRLRPSPKSFEGVGDICPDFDQAFHLSEEPNNPSEAKGGLGKALKSHTEVRILERVAVDYWYILAYHL